MKGNLQKIMPNFFPLHKQIDIPVGGFRSEEPPLDLAEIAFSDTLEANIPFGNQVDTYVVPIIFGMIFLIGVLGNGILILIFMRHRNIRNVPNTYIISLALGELLLILTSLPFAGTVYTFDSWLFGETICKVSETTKDISFGVSVLTLTALSVELNSAESSAMLRSISSKPASSVIAIAIWLLAGLLAMPSAFFSNLKTVELADGHEIEYCTPYPEEFGEKYRKEVVLFKFLAYYAVPLCIIAGSNILISKCFKMTKKNMPGEKQRQSSQIQTGEKVATMVHSLVIIFMICLLPHHVFMLRSHFYPASHDDSNEFWITFRVIAFCLSFIHSCINPIALYFISRRLRKYFNRYLFVCSKSRCQNSDNKPIRANDLYYYRRNSRPTHQISSAISDASSPLAEMIDDFDSSDSE